MKTRAASPAIRDSSKNQQMPSKAPSTSKTPKMPWAWMKGFGGLPEGGFFGCFAWIEETKPPGHTSQAEMLSFRSSMRSLFTLSYFLFSPNLIWFSIALAWYACFPYDLASASQGWSYDWVCKRLLGNTLLALGYYGFFFCSLYVMSLGKRKYRAGSYPTAGNMIHNLWYWILGVLQWTLSECAMMRLWATGKVPFISNTELLTSPQQLLILIFWILVVPQWRDLHFYIVHRFSHIRSFYKYVHALHHRNTDPEPFSGICMHPVEHLMYYSNALIPTLYVSTSPFIFNWIWIHLVLAPGAGHSGWEDHWQADQYHYLHHAKFECNYGSPNSAWIDQFCGTFREQLGSSKEYTGEYAGNYESGAKDADNKYQKKLVWSPQGYLGLQTTDHLIYTIFCLGTTSALFWAALVNPGSSEPIKTIAALPLEHVIAFQVSLGPIIVAMMLCAFNDKMNWRWPFQKENLCGTFGVMIVAAWFACLQPTYRFVQLICTM
eukprot:TRINITY_DN33639_c0_g1_i1.p1 TRINITY_DN33639_c0_g1~~TRINITY_DN33639_c0_g1_i1.p1  ORF type:complete len:491 (-),score=48.52 TRINITY_DN33639_c0_g1_i1:90-1562(-)